MKKKLCKDKKHLLKFRRKQVIKAYQGYKKRKETKEKILFPQDSSLRNKVVEIQVKKYKRQYFVNTFGTALPGLVDYFHNCQFS